MEFLLRRYRFIPRGEHGKAVLCRELLHLSECGQHPNIVQLKVAAAPASLGRFLPAPAVTTALHVSACVLLAAIS